MQVDLRRRGLQSFNPFEFATSEEHLQLLLTVSHLDLSHNALYTIRGLEGLTHLTVLRVAHNGLRSLGGGLPLTLKELDASHNSLRTLQDAALLPLTSLTTLNVSFNELQDLRGVPNVTAQLTQLDVRSNRLSALHGIEHCGQLRTLHAEDNLLREVADVAALSCLHSLTSVFLAENPLLLRKRLLQSVRHLLPMSVDHDDIPTTTAVSSSMRSSTAAPPSVPDTSSVCSLDTSAAASYVDSQDAATVHNGSRLRRPARPPIQAVTTAAAVTAAASSQRPASVVPELSPTAAKTPPTPSRNIVGGAGDSPPCPRRALPLEHRLDGITREPVVSAGASLRRFPPHAATTAAAVPSPSLLLSGRGPSTHACASSSSIDVRRGVLSRETLEEQLVRVMAERDAYRSEVSTLRTMVADLQQQLAAAKDETAASAAAPSVELTSSAVSDLLPGVRPSRTVLSIDASSPKEAPTRNGLRTGTVASSSFLAVEMSAASSASSAHSGLSGERETHSAANTAPRPAVVHAPVQQGVQSLGVVDRRAIAALFMAKLQNASAA